MEISKIFTVLCAFLLVICLVLSITTLVVMRNAIAETEAWEDRAAGLAATLDSCLSDFQEKQDQAVIAPLDPEHEEQKNGFFLRAVGGRIGIFTADGYRICTSDVEILTLPPQERALLEAGIYAKNREELARLMQDYES